MTREEERSLLRFVRRTAEDALTDRAAAVAPGFADDVSYGGVFVTFRNRGSLRGYMGTLTAPGPFTGALADVTRSSLRDPRFTHRPITIEELSDIDIEVSILGPVSQVGDPSGLQVGKHGVVVSQGGRSGCFLPHVAVENGWTIEQFLTECCRQKAGLAADAWRDRQTRIEAFEVEVLAEQRAADGLGRPPAVPQKNAEKDK